MAKKEKVDPEGAELGYFGPDLEEQRSYEGSGKQVDAESPDAEEVVDAANSDDREDEEAFVPEVPQAGEDGERYVTKDDAADPQVPTVEGQVEAAQDSPAADKDEELEASDSPQEASDPGDKDGDLFVAGSEKSK